MYESLTGKRTTLQQITNNNFTTLYQTQIVNSQHGLGLREGHYTVGKLRAMLKERNRRYQGRAGGWGGLGLGLVEGFRDGGDPGGRDERAVKLDTYGNQAGQQILDALQQQFCQFGLDSQLDFESNPHKQDKDSQFISLLAKNLRTLNSQTIKNRAQNPDLVQLRGLKFLQLLQSQDPYFIQLARQLQIAQNHSQPLQILRQIFQGDNPKAESYLQSLLECLSSPQSQAQIDQKIYLLFLLEPPSHRPLLSHYLYTLNNEPLFTLLTHYDKLFDQSQPHTMAQIKQYERELDKFVEGNQLTAELTGLVCLMSSEGGLIVPVEEMGRGRLMGVGEALAVAGLLMGVKVFRWLDVRLEGQVDRQAMNKLIMKSFIKYQLHLPTVASMPQSLYTLKLGYYPRSFTLLPDSQKLLLLLLIALQPSPFQQLHTAVEAEFPLVRYQKELACMMGELVQVGGSWEMGFVEDCVAVLVGVGEYQGAVRVLTSSRDIVEGVDWQYILSTIPNKHQQATLTKPTILHSISLYSNTAHFLNSSLPIQSILPYFQIELLIAGLKAILTENAPLTEKDKAKFFGMISIYRGEGLPEEYRFSMAVLEMMVQGFVMRGAIVEEDWKGLGLSLRSNLQEYKEGEEQMAQFSARMTQSTRTQSILRIHNHEYIKKIGSPDFLASLAQHPEYQHLYTGYIYSMAEGICKIKQSRQKIIRRSKLELWIQILLGKIGGNLRECQGELYKKLMGVRERVMRLFAMHSF